MLGEDNILFMLFFVIGGIIFGALMMYLVMDARRTKNAGKDTPTQPFPTMVNPEENELEETPNVVFEQNQEKNEMFEIERNRKKTVSFWKDVQTGRTIVHINDGWFENTTQMDADSRNVFERTLREGAQWLDLALTKPRPASEEKMQAQPGGNAQPVSAVVDTPIRKKSIVEQVDEILQELIVSSPLKDQKIRLTEMYNKGVVVWVGQNYYEGIDVVPDEQVKSLIKQAVKKWEADNSSR